MADGHDPKTALQFERILSCANRIIWEVENTDTSEACAADAAAINSVAWELINLTRDGIDETT
jgi:hypothetical protein